MEYYEFIAKLVLFDKFIVGQRKGCYDELIIGIPNDENSFYPVYSMSGVLIANTEDFSIFYDYIHALVAEHKKELAERISILDRVIITT